MFLALTVNEESPIIAVENIKLWAIALGFVPQIREHQIVIRARKP